MSDTLRTVRIRRRLPAAADKSQWMLDLEVELSIPDPDELLAGSEDFLVDAADGHEVGVVDGVETGPDGVVAALMVAGGWSGRRRARIPVEAIEAILPAQRRIILR